MFAITGYLFLPLRDKTLTVARHSYQRVCTDFGAGNLHIRSSSGVETLYYLIFHTFQDDVFGTLGIEKNPQIL